MPGSAASNVARTVNTARDAVNIAKDAVTAPIHEFTSLFHRTGTAPEPQPGQSGSTDQLGAQTALQTLDDPKSEINKLNSDGDQVVMAMTAEGKLQVPLGKLPLGVGGKAQYGFNITVKQVGDNPLPGTNGKPPVYEVTFDKNLLAGAMIEPAVPGVDPAAELNVRTSGSVTMRFNSKEDAARAVTTLQRLAASETVRDTANAMMPFGIGGGLPNPFGNPVTGEGGGLPTVGDLAANFIKPSADDMTFLRDHVTSYTSRLGVQERVKIAAKFANLGIEPRFDGNQWISRTVELPHDGQPGRVTYTLSGDLQASTKEKFTVGAQQLDQLEIGYVPQNIVDHGQLRGEVSMSWDLPPGATSGGGAPELNALMNGEPLRAPNSVTAQLTLDYQTQGLTDLSRTDMRRLSISATTQNPGSHAGAVINNLMNGDLQGAFRTMGNDFTVTARNEAIRRDGAHEQHEVGVELADVFEAKVSLEANIGLDDITSRQSRTLTGTQIADMFGNPQGSPPVQVPPVPPQQMPPQPVQLVVMPNQGLNIHTQPSVDGPKISAFRNGTFLQATGQHQTDAQGNEWVEVRGPDAGNHAVQGWVEAKYVRPHPAGAMDGKGGRVDPSLEAQGYRTYVVKPGDTLWEIAKRDGVRFQQLVQLNGSHLINPGMIFPGDIIYIPGTAPAMQIPQSCTLLETGLFEEVFATLTRPSQGGSHFFLRRN